MDEQEWVVTEDFDGQRVDAFLAASTGSSRALVQQLIQAQLVGIDGAVVAKSERVRTGQVVSITGTLPEATKPQPPVVDIVYADKDIMVVNKPPGLAVHDGAGVRVATLVDALIAQGMPPSGGPEPDRPGIVHRIDRDTSGLLAVARTQAGYDCLRPQFQHHSTHREYWALCQGVLDPPSVTIDAPIVRSPSKRTTYTTGEGGRPSVTHVSTLATHQVRVGAEYRDISEVIVTLETGRTHQVRVHLRALHLPLIGDEAYGADMRLAKKLGITRQALHARRLTFTGMDGETLDFECPIPDDLTVIHEVH
ncbi:RluA family pseudouridine synthase [Stomatohabitans albus]|uniref:RluA family pseudouridine synthase n=1 Tax=Stomatohabitans albus TaxID=3110766 RepID=UPI00300CB2B5